jgi:hypothetical protein
MTAAGFELLPGEHPIIPIMIGDAALAGRLADQLLAEGIYVIGFSFPVVPKGAARIRTQMSAGLTDAQLDRALAAFTQAFVGVEAQGFDMLDGQLGSLQTGESAGHRGPPGGRRKN